MATYQQLDRAAALIVNEVYDNQRIDDHVDDSSRSEESISDDSPRQQPSSGN